MNINDLVFQDSCIIKAVFQCLRAFWFTVISAILWVLQGTVSVLGGIKQGHVSATSDQVLIFSIPVRPEPCIHSKHCIRVYEVVSS